MNGGWYSVLKSRGWFYTGASRTKTRTGLGLNMPQQPPSNKPLLPLDHIKARRLDVLAEMARLKLLHVQTAVRVAPTTPAADAARIAKARLLLREARRKFGRR